MGTQNKAVRGRGGALAGTQPEEQWLSQWRGATEPWCVCRPHCLLPGDVASQKVALLPASSKPPGLTLADHTGAAKRNVRKKPRGDVKASSHIPYPCAVRVAGGCDVMPSRPRGLTVLRSAPCVLPRASLRLDVLLLQPLPCSLNLPAISKGAPCLPTARGCRACLFCLLFLVLWPQQA